MSHMYTNQSMSMFRTNINVSSGLRWNHQRQENIMLEITISSHWSPKTITSTNF